MGLIKDKILEQLRNINDEPDKEEKISMTYALIYKIQRGDWGEIVETAEDNGVKERRDKLMSLIEERVIEGLKDIRNRTASPTGLDKYVQVMIDSIRNGDYDDDPVQDLGNQMWNSRLHHLARGLLLQDLKLNRGVEYDREWAVGEAYRLAHAMMLEGEKHERKTE